MAVVTTEKLTPTVGALIEGVDREPREMHRTTFAGDEPIQ